MVKNIIFESLTTGIIKSESIWQGYLSINDNKNINNDLVNAIINNEDILVSVVYEDNSENELSITKKEVDTESALKSFNYEFDEGYIRTDSITNVAFSMSSELAPIKFVFYIEAQDTPVMLKSSGLRSGSNSTEISKIKLSNTTYNIKDATARADILTKQDALVSGTNIKTVNNQSLLGSGNITIESGSDYTAGDGIDITNNEVSNTAPMYVDELGVYQSAVPINADLLDGTAKGDLQINMDLLWVNASQLSTFGAQQIPLDLSNYSMVCVYFRNSGGTAHSSVLALKDKLTLSISIYSARMTSRSFTATNSGVQFGDGNSVNTYGSQTTDNTKNIPIEIYGVKSNTVDLTAGG